MTVAQKQHLLAYLGYHLDACDGVWGPKTQAATEAFQRDYSLTPDGIFGDATAKKILDVIASGEVPIIKQEEKKAEDQAAAEGGGAEKYLQADGFYHIPRGVDVQLTRNFWAHEIHCQGVGCCTESVISKRIIDLAQEIRDDLGEPLSIGDAGGSGYRCPIHNAEIRGASPKSLHTLSEAVDLHYKAPPKLKAAAKRHLTDGEIGLYSWGCHVGRWDRGYVSEFTG